MSICRVQPSAPISKGAISNATLRLFRLILCDTLNFLDYSSRYAKGFTGRSSGDGGVPEEFGGVLGTVYLIDKHLVSAIVRKWHELHEL